MNICLKKRKLQSQRSLPKRIKSGIIKIILKAIVWIQLNFLFLKLKILLITMIKYFGKKLILTLFIYYNLILLIFGLQLNLIIIYHSHQKVFYVMEKIKKILFMKLFLKFSAVFYFIMKKIKNSHNLFKYLKQFMMNGLLMFLNFST